MLRASALRLLQRTPIVGKRAPSPTHSPSQLATAVASLRVKPSRQLRARSSAASDVEVEGSTTAMASDPKLVAMRAAMKTAGVDAFLVPSQDPHFSEYVPTCFERRMFISGFTGSAGTALVTHDEALLWTDGRYFLQAEQELGPEWTLMRGGQPGVPEPSKWLADKMAKGSRVGVDPNVHSLSETRALRAALEPVGSAVVTLGVNPVDTVWGTERPPFPTAPLRVHKAEFSGQSVADKIELIRGKLRENKSDVLVVSPLDEVAWLFNVRGGDLDYNPVTLGYGLVGEDDACFYVDEGKATDEVRAHLAEAGVTVKPYDACAEDMRAAATAGKTLWIDADKVSVALAEAAEEAAAAAGPADKRAKTDAGEDKKPVKEGVSPIPLAKSVKNEAELAGMLEAHLRDGVGGRLRYHGLDGCRRERLKHGLDAQVITSRDQGHPAVLPDRRGGVGRSGSSWLGSHVRETHRFDRLFVDEGSMKGFTPRFRARGGFGCIRRSPPSAERIHRSTRRTAGAPRPLALSKSEMPCSRDDGSISAWRASGFIWGI